MYQFWIISRGNVRYLKKTRPQLPNLDMVNPNKGIQLLDQLILHIHNKDIHSNKWDIHKHNLAIRWEDSPICTNRIKDIQVRFFGEFIVNMKNYFKILKFQNCIKNLFSNCFLQMCFSCVHFSGSNENSIFDNTNGVVDFFLTIGTLKKIFPLTLVF